MSQLDAKINQRVIVQNRGGAGLTIGMAALVQAPPVSSGARLEQVRTAELQKQWCPSSNCPFLSYLVFFSRHAQGRVLQAPVLARGAV